MVDTLRLRQSKIRIIKPSVEMLALWYQIKTCAFETLYFTTTFHLVFEFKSDSGIAIWLGVLDFV